MSEQQPAFLKVADYLKKQDEASPFAEGYTFDDIILLPSRSVVMSPSEVSTSSQLTDNIRLDNPIISANMDSVTETEMAIKMAINGGIGALHRAKSIDYQVHMVEEVKDSFQYVIDEPPLLTPNDTAGRAAEVMEKHKRGYAVIIDAENKLHGIVTKRDLHPKFVSPDELLNNTIYTSHERGLVVAPPDISVEDAQRMMWENRVEKLILVDGEGNVGGVITDRDIQEIQRYPNATRDTQGRLQVLGSIGVGPGSDERAQALEHAGADGIIIDVLHGDSPQVLELTKILKRKLTVPIIVGNVAGTEREVQDLIDVGADVIKVGYGPGSFCTTRLVTGTGSAQWSAIVRSAAVAYQHNKSIIADGGIRQGGDIAKALAGGAAAVMIGGMFIGTDESPRELLRDSDGSLYKIGRGSASSSASLDFAKSSGVAHKKRAPQGVDAVKIPYSGSVEDMLYLLKDGVRHGIANVGGNDIESFRREVRFEKESQAALSEARPHATNRSR